eukprot:COSAG01_NODE_53442_length_339_cov_0.787500_1_plen_53_part_10
MIRQPPLLYSACVGPLVRVMFSKVVLLIVPWRTEPMLTPWPPKQLMLRMMTDP